MLGKHSGRHAFRERVRELGFELEEREVNEVFARFKALADRKKELFDGDIEALVLERRGRQQRPVVARCGLPRPRRPASPRAPTSSWRTRDGRRLKCAATGDGPVDAAFKAIEQAIGLPLRLRKFEVRSVSEGEDAQGEALVTVDCDGRTYRGSSVSTNIVESGVRAFLEVVNRIELVTAGRTARRSAAVG